MYTLNQIVQVSPGEYDYFPKQQGIVITIAKERIKVRLLYSQIDLWFLYDEIF